MDFGYLLASSYPGAFIPGMLFSGFGLAMLAVVAVCVVANWKLYEKAGKEGWASIIPVYNLAVLLEIVKRPIWWVVLMFIPIVNIITIFIVSWDLAKAFGKDLAYGVGLFFLGIVFVPMLAFGDARYVYAQTSTEPTPPPTPPTPPVNPTA
jgi:hypothetical protein